MTSTPLFSWLHISDLHFGHGSAGHRWDQRLVLEALQRDAAALTARAGLVPNAVLVTGDVAFSGDPAQYQDAVKWLNGLAKREDGTLTLVVPGNHDVDRAADRHRATKRLVWAIREGHEELDAALEDPEDRDRLAGRMKAYIDFAKQCNLADGTGDDLWWSRPVSGSPRLPVRIVGLNTALLAADGRDKGRLRLGRAMIAQTLGAGAAKPSANEAVIVMSHHPLDQGWLADEREITGWLRQKAHIHLCGHVHEAASQAVWAGSGTGIVHVVAGAAHGEQMPEGVPAGHGYNLAALFAGDDGSVRLRVWPRKWSDRNKDFRADVDGVDEARGYAEHALSVKASPA
jgi:calcineurin-like phosphoesterase family protein